MAILAYPVTMTAYNQLIFRFPIIVHKTFYVISEFYNLKYKTS